MLNKKKLLFSSLLLYSLLFSSVVIAQNEEPYLGPKLEICMDSKNNCVIPDGIQNIQAEEKIIFKYSLINNGKCGWVCWNHWRYTIVYEHEKIEDFFGTFDIHTSNHDSSLKYCLPPNEKLVIYIPFEYFNNLKEDEKLHEWTITPKATVEKIKCYQDLQFTERVFECESEVHSEGNRIKLNVFTELPKTNPELWNTWNNICQRIMAVGDLSAAILAIGTLLFIVFVKHWKTSTKKTS